MIIKSFNLNDLKNTQSNMFLFYGENEGLKDEIIRNCFLNNFNGEIIKYDENQILENRNNFYEVCLNESLFGEKKIILVSRVTSKISDIAIELSEIEIHNKKIIFNSGNLEKKSKLRQFFEKEKKLVCTPFYQDNAASLYKIANDFFKSNKILISSENINLIVESCSGDRKNLNNEMDKILNFSFGRKKINRNEILKLVNLFEDENYFELIDSCLSKNNKKVCKIINNKTFNKNESIILIRTFLSRLKRLIELKKLEIQLGNAKATIDNFKPPIFWKERPIVEKQIEIWSTEMVYDLLEKVNTLEIGFKRNSNLSNNLVYDLILDTSNN